MLKRMAIMKFTQMIVVSFTLSEVKLIWGISQVVAQQKRKLSRLMLQQMAVLIAAPRVIDVKGFSGSLQRI